MPIYYVDFTISRNIFILYGNTFPDILLPKHYIYTELRKRNINIMITFFNSACLNSTKTLHATTDFIAFPALITTS